MNLLLKYGLKIFPRGILIRGSYLVLPLLTFFYRGKKFQDPIDGKTFSRLLPYGYRHLRKNALSPSTLSLERHRLIWLYLKNETDFFSKKREMLHVAPEQPFYKKFKQLPNIDYTTTDLRSPLADHKASLTNLPFREDTFDVIFCNHVLEHILEDKKAMKELFRVMKKDGWGIFQVPLDDNRKYTFEDNTIISKKERAQHFGQYDHVRIYGQDYFNRLKNVGFDVKPIKYAKLLPSEQIERYALDENETLVLCYKPK